MKLYYPYYNLFRSVGTGVYSLETVVKIPGGTKIGKITQTFDGEYYKVTLPVEGAPSEIKDDKNINFNRIKLTPKSEKELVKIKIDVVPVKTTETRDPDPDGGGGNTGAGEAEDEMP